MTHPSLQRAPRPQPGGTALTDTGSPPAVQLSGLTKSFGDVRAVGGIDVTIAPGEIVAFLGPNGAGKSTTNEMILGLVKPDAGRVAVFGRDPVAAVQEGRLTSEQVAGVAREVGITFCFAPRFHAALRHAAPARRALGVPTVMNVLGPLSHPARPQYQLVGVADASRIELVSETFRTRGSAALVVRGRDGLDKLSVTGPTDVTLVSAGRRSSLTLAPEDVGLYRSSMESLLGSTATDNAQQLAEILAGEVAGPVTDAVVLNAAAACVLVEGQHDSFVDRLADRVRRCQEVLTSGAAGQALHDWVAAAQRQQRPATSDPSR